ncbi:FAD-dependent oxidoreductase [Streptomyces sp. CB03238]|uniref:NAD(P)/FAD-dependent oxidoreductase n=1 Tax=Streptomyces sp. CB03238 TaxID=1907777 RepID=UPI000A112D69|nr:FAD-dependent oxidoreductase [Streptomyces sp. CB03238]ORT55925.1 oxidoreductase [Streptomyces sp. CB03238]
MTATRTVDVLVVGAGPAGRAAAARLAALGAGTVEVLEREAGGAPRPSGGAVIRTGVTATGWAGPLTLDTTSPAGLERVTARAVVLATGARERPRAARLVPGTRPAGVLTGGELRRAVYGYGQAVGTRAVVVGADPAAFGAVRALRRAGVAVAALVTEEVGRTSSGWRPVPVLRGTTVTELLGRGRLSGVRLRHRDGREATVACDTVVFTGDWVPEHEPARCGGVVLDPGTRGPAVDGAFRTSVAGVFAVGDVLHGGEPAGTAVAEGRAVAGPVLSFLSGAVSWPERPVPVVVDAPLRWVTPSRIGGPAGGGFLLRAAERLVRPVVTVRQDGAVLHRQRVWRTATPSRSVVLAGGWTGRVEPEGGPVRITVAGRPPGRHG